MRHEQLLKYAVGFILELFEKKKSSYFAAELEV